MHCNAFPRLEIKLFKKISITVEHFARLGVECWFMCQGDGHNTREDDGEHSSLLVTIMETQKNR